MHHPRRDSLHSRRLDFTSQAFPSPNMAATPLKPATLTIQHSSLQTPKPAAPVQASPATPEAPGINPRVPLVSPASTESLLHRTFPGLIHQQWLDSPAASSFSPLPPSPATVPPAALSDLLARFSDMLASGLAQTASQITSSIKADLQNLGARIEITEQALEQTMAHTNQNSKSIQHIQDQLDSALNKIDEMENRSRRYNFRIRGLPESFKDSHEVAQTLIRELVPDITEQKLELDRAHRALQAPRQDGLPRDIVVKPHYYSVKDQLMKSSRAAPNLTLLGHPIQIFADISPNTIQRRRSLKPLLQHLNQHNIKYRWSFPFRLQFQHMDKAYSFTSLPEGERLLLQLGIISTDAQEQPMEVRPSSSKRPLPTSPLANPWKVQQSRKQRKDVPP